MKQKSNLFIIGEFGQCSDKKYIISTIDNMIGYDALYENLQSVDLDEEHKDIVSNVYNDEGNKRFY